MSTSEYDPIIQTRASIFEQLVEFTTQQMEALHVPGVAIGVIEPDGDEYIEGLGVTNVNHPLAVTNDTLFQVGSITKTITALVAMRLVDQGHLSLDEPIRKYWPDFLLRDEATAQRLSMRDLLTHVGGFEGDFFIDTGEGDDAIAIYAQRVSETTQALPLRSAHSYNNAGFVLAGYVFEQITGQAYEAIVQEMVFEPLGMTNSYFGARDVMVHRFAVGHQITTDGPHVAEPWPLSRGINPAGGIVSTVGDMLRYAQFQMGDGTTADGKRLLSAELMRELHSEHVPIRGSQGRALAWGYDDAQGVVQLGHGGGTNGQKCQLLVVPERNFAFCILTNADAALDRAVLTWVQQEYLGLVVPEPTPMATQPVADEYLGLYARNMLTYEIMQTEAGLQVHVTLLQGFPAGTDPKPTPPPASIAFYEEDAILVTDDKGLLAGVTAHFVRDASNKVIGLSQGGRINVRVRI